jgi:hypothetical protein
MAYASACNRCSNAYAVLPSRATAETNLMYLPHTEEMFKRIDKYLIRKCMCEKCRESEKKDAEDYIIGASPQFVKTWNNRCIRSSSIIHIFTDKSTSGMYNVYCYSSNGSTNLVERFKKDEDAIEFMEQLIIEMNDDD